MANTKVTSRVLANDAVLTANIADDQVTTAKIADDVALGGNPTTTTQSAGNNTTRIATTAFVTTAVANIVDSAPSALDTLNELAAALGDDANFSTTVTNSIAAKLPLAGGTMTGNIIMGDDTSIGIADDAERIEFDGAGDINILGANLGIGETDPSGYWGQANDIVIDTSGNGGVTIKSTTNGNARIAFTDTKSSTAGLNDGGLISYLHSDDAMTFQTAGDEAIRIDNTGNVGIGGSPQSTVGKLDIIGASANYNTAPMITFKTTGTNAANRNWSIGALDINYGDFHIGSGDSNSDFFDATAHSKFTIDKDGNVGIGTTSPTTLTELRGTIPTLTLSSSESKTWSNGDDIAKISFFSRDGSGIGAHETGFILNESENSGASLSGALVFGVADYNTAAAEAMRIDHDGNVGIGDATPEALLDVGGGYGSNTTVATFAHATDAYIEIENMTSQNGAGIILTNAGTKKWTIQKDTSAHYLTIQDTSGDVMTFLQGGNVGIGTNAPHEMLHVEGGDGTQALVAVKEDTATATASYMFKVDSTGTDVRKKAGLIFQRDDPGTRGTGTLHICVDGVNDEGSAAISDSKMAFPADGTVLSKGNFYVSSETSAFTAGTHNGNLIQVNGQSLSSRAASNAQTHKSFVNSNGTVGSITTNGSATAFNTSSDYRLKENVVTDWNGTTLLKQLKPSKFNFIADADTTLQGFLAHEVSSIVPQAVTGEKDAIYTAEEAEDDIDAVEGQPKYQSIDHSKLVPLLVKTIQELEARIEALES